MNLKHDNSKLSTIIVVSILIFSQLFYSCNNRDRKVPVSVQDSVSQNLADTIFVHDTLYLELEVPFPVLKDTTIYKDVYVYPIVDTFAILSAYNTKRVNIDTLKIDYGYVTVIDTVSGGNILSRKYFSKIKLPVKESTQKVKEEPRGNLYLGLNGGLDKPNYVYSLGTSLLYKTPKDKIYEIGLGVWNQTINGTDGRFIPYIRGGVYWKVDLKNKNK
jgi:hypothetical protein